MVTGSRSEKLAALLKTGNHQILSGISENLGGNNDGFDPHELLQAALSACTIITVQMYANRKNWDLISTDVKVDSKTEGEITQINREVSFRGNLNQEQKQKLLEIANHCPLHRLLTGKINILTETQEKL